MQIIAGLHTFFARFLFNGTNASNAVYVCSQMGTRTDQDMKIISCEAILKMKPIEARLTSGPYPGITLEVRF